MNTINAKVSTLDEVYAIINQHGGDNGNEWSPTVTTETADNDTFLYTVKVADGNTINFFGVDAEVAKEIYGKTF